MNERKAREEGLSFTGIYSHDKEEVKERISKERKERPKARIILVTVPPNKLSRGHHGTGYSAYADEVYFAYENMKAFKNYSESYNASIKRIEDEYKEKILLAEKTYAKNKAKFEEAKAIVEG